MISESMEKAKTIFSTQTFVVTVFLQEIIDKVKTANSKKLIVL